MSHCHTASVAMTLVVCAAACGPERPPAPGSYASGPQAAQAPAGRKDLPDTAYQVAWGEVKLPAALEPGQRVDVPVTFTNASPVTWPGSGVGEMYVVRLSHCWLRPDGQVVQNYGDWRQELGAPIAPQQTLSITDTVTAPAASGDYVVQFDLVHEGVAMFADRGAARQLVKVKVR